LAGAAHSCVFDFSFSSPSAVEYYRNHWTTELHSSFNLERVTLKHPVTRFLQVGQISAVYVVR
jgi:hypothetical protein